MKRTRLQPDVLFLVTWIVLIATGYFAAVKYIPVEIPNVFTGFIVINIATFFLYGLDKLLAVAQTRRVPERTLQLTAFLFGSPGALFAMNVFRHKTQKTSFQFILALLILLQVLSVFGVFYFYQPSNFSSLFL